MYFIEIWWDKYASAKAPNTKETYRVNIDNYINPYLGEREISEINVEDIEWFKTELLNRYSSSSVKNILVLTKMIFKYAVEWGYIKDNPAQKVRYPKTQKRHYDCLNSSEVKLLLDNTSSHEWYCYFLIAVSTGMRYGEIAIMKWKFVDWEDKKYHITQNWIYVARERGNGIGTPKTPSSENSVNLTPSCIEALKIHKENQEKRDIEINEESGYHDLIFCTQKGTPYDRSSVMKRQFLPALKKAGLQRIRFHDLRHSFASILINSGVNFKYIQRQLRHSSIKTTFDIYGHLFPEKDQEITSNFDKTIFG
jgi:integrase